jgi:NAD(P)H dehydrogenase (quinone)
VIRGPAGNGRLAPVARDDLADVAAAVLTADGAHDGETYNVTGPESLSLHQVAEVFALVTGRPISYVNEPLEEARAFQASLRRSGLAGRGVGHHLTS